jgi:DNA-directed RNA polymerase subunit RPC12/RpoP
MVHYSCDLCKREFDPDDDLRYVVKIEIFAAYDGNACAATDDDDHDHLQEIQDILESMEDAEDERIGDDVYQQLRFDLCPDCRRKFLKNPLARETPAKAFGFSSN